MQGSISAHNRNDQRGAEFICSMHLEILPRQSPAKNIPQGIKILLLEDHPPSAQAISSYLQFWGLSCTLLQSAEQALEELRRASQERQHYQLAIIDLDLEGAPCLAKQIEATPSWDALRLIVLGKLGWGSETEREELNAFAFWLNKPVLPGALRRAIVQSFGDPPSDGSLLTKESCSQVQKSQGNLGRRLQVLIAEDHPGNQIVCRTFLEKMGIRCNMVSNGQEALQALSTVHYDMVLMDCQMPVLDGYAATQAIRERERASGRHTVIIAITAHALPEDRQRCLDAGMDDYLAKPISLQSLASMLQRWMPERGAQ